MKRLILFLLVALFSLFSLAHSQEPKWERLLAKPCYDVWVNPQNPNTILVGGEGRRVWRSFDGGQTWDSSLVGGFAGTRERFNNIHINSNDTNVVIVGGLLFGNVRRSTNLGKDWEIVLTRDKSVALNGKALMVRSDEPDTYIIGDYTTSIIFKSTDQGRTWDSISTVTRPGWKKVDGEWEKTEYPVGIGSMGIRQDSADIVFCGDVNGNMFLSQDGGYTWNFVDSLLQNGERPKFYRDTSWGNDQEITRIVFSENDPRVGYAVITYLFPNDVPNGGLWKTTDGGYSWDLLGFPDTSMWACATRNYKGKDEIFIGGYTEHYYPKEEDIVPGVGIVRGSTDGGKTWINYDNQMNWFVEAPWRQAKFWDAALLSNNEFLVCGGWYSMYRSDQAGKDWTENYIELKDKKVYSIDFVTDSLAYICGEDGMIMKTTNQGTDWITLRDNKNNDLHTIDFVDENVGYCAGDNGMILKTNDGGENWQLVDAGVFRNLRSIWFFDENTGFVAGYNGALFRTSDGAESWQQIKTNSNDHLESIYMLSPEKGFAVGMNGVFYKMENISDIIDNEETLQSVQLAEVDSLNKVYFIDDNTGFIGGSGGLMLKTNNGGSDWYETVVDADKTINSVVFSDESTGIAVGELMYIFLTTDGGENWTTISNGHGPRALVWSQRYFGPPDDRRLYMATEAGFFMLDVEDFINVVDLTDNSNFKVYVAGNDILNVSYMNPMGEDTKILTVSDLQGKIMLEKRYSRSLSDEINDIIDVSNWPKGVYFCRMLDGENMSVVKIIK